MLTYDPWVPIPRLPDRWSCLASSLHWAVTALGVAAPADRLRNDSRDQKLIFPNGRMRDQTGHELAAFATEHLGDLGVGAHFVFESTFDQVAAEAGMYPLLLGSPVWRHTVGVRDYDPMRDVLVLANSVPGWRQIGPILTRLAFAAYHPMFLVRVTTADAVGQIGEQVEHNERRGRLGIDPPRSVLVGPRLVAPEPYRGAATRGLRELARRSTILSPTGAGRE